MGFRLPSSNRMANIQRGGKTQMNEDDVYSEQKQQEQRQ
jgi:hypothetical protein